MRLEELKTVHKTAWKAWGDYLNRPSAENLITVLNLIVDDEYCGELMSQLCGKAGDHVEKVLQEHQEKLDTLTRILMEIALKELRN
jgi:hypothetical protein